MPDMELCTVILGMLILATGTSAKWYQGCDSASKGIVSNVTVPGCAESLDYCKVKLGTNMTIAIAFTPKINGNKLTMAISGKMGPEWFPFPSELYDSNACNTGVKCPMMAGSNQQYKNVIYIQPSFPTMSAKTKWILTTDGKVVFCEFIMLQTVP